MEYNVSGVTMADEVGEISKEYMRQKQTSTMMLWNPEELEIPEEASVDATFWQRRRFVLVAGVLIVLVLFIGIIGWQNTQASQYQQVVQQNAILVVQQSRHEATCFRQAQTAKQRDACALTASTITASLQRQFGNVPIPASQHDAANEMQNAYAALNAASCYDSASHSADDACLGGITSRLRVAILDANDAAQN
jgi:predicted negative regulator of RcsB-dependent stress response